MSKQAVFSVAIRCVFLFAFIAFLSASVSHVAVFFNNFEADKSNWIEPYMLAISIDLTALVLTVGVMFFRKEMPWYALTITWLFIIGLTSFSWVTNWEYAQTYQGTLLKTNSFLLMLNPILASSFAFFNLVYSFVSEFFSMKVQTADELQKELERLEALETVQNRIDAYRQRNKKASIIQRAKETLIEAKEAVNELKNGTEEELEAEVKTELEASPDMELEEEPQEELSEEVFFEENGTDEELDSEPEMEALNVVPFRQSGTPDFPKTSIKEKIGRKKLLTIAQAAEELQCSQRYVRELRKKGTLATDESGLITSASLKAYKKKRTSRLEA